MAGAVDITDRGECEVLADVEVLLTKEQECLRDQVALHDHHGVLLCHLKGEGTKSGYGQRSMDVIFVGGKRAELVSG